MAPFNTVGTLCMFLVSWGYVLICPFTKVEESFNIQAMHDILFYGFDVEQYDHLVFPGVVPRTFIGSLVIAIVSYPGHVLLHLFNMDKIYRLYLCRFVLASIHVMALAYFKKSLVNRFKIEHLDLAFSLVTISEFHYMFYSSRTLPNTFASMLITIGLALWLQKSVFAISIFAFTCIVFRCDLVLLAFPVLLTYVIDKKFKFWNLIFVGIVSSLVSLALTVFIDSYFWKRLLWPEGEVFYFNTILNRSSEYGISPFFWYFTSVIPRLCTPLNLLVLPFAFASKTKNGWKFDTVSFYLIFPCIVFIFLYSILPHKELRFLLPSVPLINAVIAISWCKIEKLFPEKLLPFRTFLSLSAVLLQMIILSLFVVASFYNYPGGNALIKAHDEISKENVSQNNRPIIHVDNLSAISGVSRFLEKELFAYSKTENLDISDYLERGFDFLLNENCDGIPGYKLLSHVDSFDRYITYYPFFLKKQAICIYKRDK